MICSSANLRTISVIAFCSSVFSRCCSAATAMWEGTPGSLASACAGGGEDTGGRPEGSEYFGPDASWAFRANSTNPNNLNSDIFFKRIIDDHVIEGLLAKAAPQGPRPEVRDIVRGYAAGYDRYLADTGVDNLPDPTCRGKPWVRPISEMDAYRRFYELALLASQGVAIDGIAGAAPAAGAALP